MSIERFSCLSYTLFICSFQTVYVIIELEMDDGDWQTGFDAAERHHRSVLAEVKAVQCHMLSLSHTFLTDWRQIETYQK